MSMLTFIRQNLMKARTQYVKKNNQREDKKIISDLGLTSYFGNEYFTTGVSHGDISFLYHYIKNNRPQRVIEFGTGKSTWVIAKAMQDYCLDYHKGDITLISMESIDHWYQEQL